MHVCSLSVAGRDFDHNSFSSSIVRVHVHLWFFVIVYFVAAASFDTASKC